MDVNYRISRLDYNLKMSLNPASSTQRPSLPRGTSTLAMWVFIAALSMLFGSMLLGYVLIRMARASTERAEISQITTIPLHTYHLPASLWLSTLAILLASLTIQLALRAVQHEKQHALRRWAGITLGLGIVFCIIQGPALWSLLTDHLALLRDSNQHTTTGGRVVINSPLLGLIFILILLHALHVVGGIVHLLIVQVGSVRGKFDHEFHAPVKHAAIYWHFLDIVWILMFITLTALG